MDELMEIYPELKMLTGDVNATPEVVNTDNNQYREYNRTMLGIDLLMWAMEGNYEKFTECQKPKKLSKENFDEICTYTRQIVKSKEDLKAMIAYLIINDLGKIKSVVNELESKIGLQTIDHDDILYQGLAKFPEISPTFNGLEEKYKRIMLNGLKTKFNMGQFIQSENLPQNLEPLVNIDRDSLDFYLLHVLYDIGGATGHVTRKGSIIINDDFWSKYKSAEKHLKEMKSNEDILQAYQKYLKDRGKVLKLEDDDKETISAIKLCNMLRISNPEESEIVLETLKGQPKNVRAILQQELTATGIGDDNAILLYYAPATMANAWQYFREHNSEKPLEDALNIILPTFARIYSQTRANIAKQKTAPDVTTVMISKIATKSGENPNELQKSNLVLQKIGEDYEVSSTPISQITTENKESLSEISFGKTVTIGMGGGSDCVQAAILAKMLQQNGTPCNSVISIRTNRTSSQDINGNMGQERTVKEPARIIDNDIYLISSETTGSGRFLENVPANDLDVYLITDREDGNLKEKIEKALQDIGDVKTLIGVDTGGDLLYPIEESLNQSITTPDQDRRVLEAINSIQGLNKKSCIIATGIDSPECADDILKSADASYIELDEEIRKKILEIYTNWNMNGENEKRFGKTPLAWQQALKNKIGVVCLDIPTRYVLDKNNPWIPFVNIQSATKGMFLMDTQKCLDAIKQYEKEKEPKNPEPDER